jgi:Zn-dependent peptidase ImmA (M78 family)/DNA-binding XRE family transcriptional regulator
VKVGTPGFSGKRLREAREVRGLSAIALSELGEVSAQSIYHYENHRISPSPDVLHRIARALDLPESFFLLPERLGGGGTVFYRSMSSATKGARARAESRFRWLQDIVAYVSQFVALPESNFPALDLPENPLLLSDKEIEDAAEAVRTYWRMGEGPIANMVLLLENHGAVIARDWLGAESLDSISAFVSPEHRPYVIVGTDKGSPVRWRFDAAHELGHVVLHANLSPEMLTRPEQFKRIEEQAHRFAAAFLLPLASFGDDLFAVNLDTLRALKPKWKVSIGMMIMRARQAELLSEDAERKLWVAVSRRKWRTIEPYDDTMETEVPRLLRRAFELLLAEGAQTAADVIGRLSLPASDIEALSGLPQGFLADYSRVALRQVFRRSDDSEDSGPASAQVIPMPTRRRTT